MVQRSLYTRSDINMYSIVQGVVELVMELFFIASSFIGIERRPNAFQRAPRQFSTFISRRRDKSYRLKSFFSNLFLAVVSSRPNSVNPDSFFCFFFFFFFPASIRKSSPVARRMSSSISGSCQSGTDRFRAANSSS